MLIITQPKSASTALAGTIAKIANVKAILGVPRDKVDVDCEGFEEIQKCHCNLVERSPLFLNQVLTGRKKLFKEHLLPTKRHLKIISKFKIPIVVILRDVDDTLDAYLRLFKANNNTSYDEKKLRKDIKDFHDKWMHYKSNRAFVIVIYYRDLVLNWKTMIKKILKHYKLAIPKKLPPLMRVKFTGIGVERILNEKKELIDVTDSTTEERINEFNVDNIDNSENSTQERAE